MRICHVGHGRIAIPPDKWGAVESIITDYRVHCLRAGHDFFVVNEIDQDKAFDEVANIDPPVDLIHLHDESKIDAFDLIPQLVVTTHDPKFFDKPNPFIDRFVRGDFMIGCLCEKQLEQFITRGVRQERLLLFPNGSRSDLIQFKSVPAHPDRLICLGIIGQRKRQHLLFPIESVDCIGPVADYDPVPYGKRSFKSWSRDQVCEHLTDYAGLILVSEFEAAPLVVIEALMAGLDVIVSEAASANLDQDQPFVHVLDEATINNPTLLQIAIDNILKQPKDRAAVRRYAEQNFDWSVLVKRYLDAIVKIT